MFITLPPFEFRTPPGLFDEGARRWRLMQINLHVPWFLLSAETTDVGSGLSHVQTICFAWETDLETFLQTFDPAAVKGLVCMAPGWASPSGTWTSHSVHQVWRVDTADEHCLVLCGTDGQELDVGLPACPSTSGLHRSLLLEIRPPAVSDSQSSRQAGASPQAASAAGTRSGEPNCGSAGGQV